jgi:4-hydroxy-tetrahydrodipicolinate synthase
VIPTTQSRAEPPAGRICTAMATPFAADGSLDLDAARALARHLVEHGSEGLVLAGTTGEGPTLSDREKLALCDAVLDEVGSDARVIANTGTYDTAHSVHLTREARQLGVHGFLAVTPYYNKPPTEGLVRHFAAIAAAAGGLPVIIYNIPQRVILNLEPELLARLAQESGNVVAVKQATTDLDQARAILEAGLVLYAGNDDLLAPFLELGGSGGIHVASHLVGSEMLRMCELAESGDFEAVHALDRELAPVFDAMNITVNPIPLKAALELVGLRAGPPRLPLVEATDEQRAVLRSALEARGLTAAA